MSKKWSRLSLKINRKRNRKSKIALILQAVAVGFLLVILLWNTIANENHDTRGLLQSMMAGIYAVPVVCALCGASGGVFAVLALRKRESLKWSIPATVISGLLLFIGVFMTIRVIFP